MSRDYQIPSVENLPEVGLLRIKQVLQFIPISKSSWWQGVREGRFPKPRSLSKRVTVWQASDIRTLIDGLRNE
jgi:predicted DNA-binding transcriptional regulator AlpA